ncbi:hypothetical protein LSM04_007981 [Trypanosoma melophagium]|uniref:uncharacterized protein n=1 Tax=Trypanosoma melophagium TaxID=715481 RepID=UPI00351A2F25|nr:hypothetical protein LSM04_007981 [Trypanosoma melophagium]
MCTSSQRRPKSPAASVRTRTPDIPPMSIQRTPEHSSYDIMMSTPAAALAANTPPPVGELQIELMSQLQDVVVRLSQSAVGEKQRLSHMQQRIDAYAVLLRE